MKKIKEQDNKSMRKEVLVFAFPIIVCHILQTMFNIVDMIWVGRLGPEAVAAISWAGNILMVLVTLIVGISVGTTSIITRNIGAKEYEEASRTAFHSLIIGGIISIVLAVWAYFNVEKVMLVLGAEPSIASFAASYLKIIFYFSVVMFFMYLISAILRGSGDMKTPTRALIYATVINFVLDPFLIFGIGFFPKLGIEGAAWAAVISRTVGTIICLKAILNGKNKIHLLPHYIKINLNIIVRILKIGIPGSLNMSMKSVAGLVMIIFVGQFGFRAVAAYGIGLKLLSFAMIFGFGLGEAAAILIGHNLGAKDYHRASRLTSICAGYNTLIMLVFAFIYFFFATPLIKIFNTDPEVIRICLEYLRVTSLAYIFVGAGFILSRALNGAGDTAGNMMISIICIWFIQIPLVLFYTQYWKMGVSGVWWGIMAASFLQGLATVMWFYQNKWKLLKV